MITTLPSAQIVNCHVKYKTVPIETHSSRFGGNFFLQPDRPCFFQSLGKKKKTKIRHTEPGRYDGHQRLWLFLLPMGHPRPFQSMARVDRVVSDTAYEWLQQNRAGECRKHNNQPQKRWRQLWAPPVMASTTAYRPSAAVPLEGEQ